MKTLRIGGRIIRTNVRDSIFYPNRLIVDTMGMFSRCGVLLLLYSYVFDLKGGVINNTTFVVAAWSMFFYFAFSAFRLRDVARAIMQDVQSGNIETLLVKPFSYLSYRAWWQIGAGFYSFAVISVVGSIILALLIGIPASMSVNIFVPSLVLVVLLGSILSLIIYMIVGVLSFWIEDINPVFWMVDKMVMILGGSYLPVALFPPVMYRIARYSPFGASQFVSHTVYESWATDWITLATVQVYWIIVLGLLLSVLYSRARKRVSVNGG